MKVGSIVFGPEGRYEKTESGVIDWKMEVDRLNRLLVRAEAENKRLREELAVHREQRRSADNG